MEQENCHLFCESILSLALEKTDHFISAFPGKLLFGKCSCGGYKKNSFFEFEVFTFYKLYLAIFDIIRSFANNTNLSQQLILSKSDPEEVNYFFSVKTLYRLEKSIQVLEFGIEKNSEIVYEFFLNENELNFFIYSLVKIIPLCICLNSTELLVFKRASSLTVHEIKLFEKENKCSGFVKQLLKETKEDQSLSNQVSVFLNYYFEIVLVYHKLESLVNYDMTFDNVASILQKITDD